VQVYPKSSEQLPTDDEIVRAISRLRAAAQPSPNCCTGLQPFITQDCACNP
jgi:hypothetical protein